MGLVSGTSTLALSEPSYEEWLEAHRVKVNVEERYAYENGFLIVETLYSAGDLEHKLGSELVKKRDKFPIEAKLLRENHKQINLTAQDATKLLDGQLIEKDRGSKVTVLIVADNPPKWWESYSYPQWAWVKTDVGYEISDPINLVWKNADKSTVKVALEGLDEENDWVDNGLLESIGAIREFVYLKDQGWVVGDNYATDSLGLMGREHMRLWTIHTGEVVAAAHEDSRVPHKAIKFEGVEQRIRSIFDESPGWSLHSEEWLDNVVSEPGDPPYSDGYASVILRSSVNTAPNTPSTPTGRSLGYTGTSYRYSTSATDPDGEQIKYTFDWGDGNTSETGLVTSGTTTSRSHSWSSPGIYHVKARATDSRGAVSKWSHSKQVTISTAPPDNPSPGNYAIGVAIDAELSWTGGDPDPGDTVTYDVYFGTGSNPPLTVQNQPGTRYDPGTLAYNTTYYWKIVAGDNHGLETEGPVWSFTTVSEDNYVEPPDDEPVDSPPIEEGMASISGELVIVLLWQPATQSWDMYFPLTGDDTIGTLEVNRAYFIYVDAACTLEYGTRTIELYAGWNNPPWPAQ